MHLDLNPREFLADDAGVYARLAALRYVDARFIAENNDAAAAWGSRAGARQPARQ